MKKLDRKAFQEAETWMWRNARPIDLALWRYHFDDGGKDEILSALSRYQNKDGGFGNTLEPDSWNPESSPYTTLYAVNMLRGIDVTDPGHPVVAGILGFLENTEYRSENGWFFSIPSNNGYARAPWWTYNEDANVFEGIGVTAELAGFVLRYGKKESEIYDRASGYAAGLIDRLKDVKEYGDMGIGGCCVLLDDIEKAKLTERFDCVFLRRKLTDLVNSSIERDTAKWPYYCVRPSNYIGSPDSFFYSGNEEIVAKELDYSIENRPADSVWDITWSWFEDVEKYPKQFSISENWWKGARAVETMKFLRNFDRIET